jgi:hypothetical protein
MADPTDVELERQLVEQQAPQEYPQETCKMDGCLNTYTPDNGYCITCGPDLGGETA